MEKMVYVTAISRSFVGITSEEDAWTSADAERKGRVWRGEEEGAEAAGQEERC